MKITVINDDTAFLQLMGDLLRGEGYDVVVWKEGDTAYEMVKRDQPDLIVLDIRLGKPEEGWQLLELFKLDLTTRHIPIIVCSADTVLLRAKEGRLQELGCETLEKPFDIDELLRKINGILS